MFQRLAWRITLARVAQILGRLSHDTRQFVAMLTDPGDLFADIHRLGAIGDNVQPDFTDTVHGGVIGRGRSVVFGPRHGADVQG